MKSAVAHRHRPIFIQFCIQKNKRLGFGVLGVEILGICEKSGDSLSVRNL